MEHLEISRRGKDFNTSGVFAQGPVLTDYSGTRFLESFLLPVSDSASVSGVNAQRSDTHFREGLE